MTTIEDAVREWVRGMYATEAGVELLIRQGKAIYEGAPWINTEGEGRAWVDVDALIEGTGAWSGGEQRLIRIAASLLGGPPVDLRVDIPSDRDDLDLVLAAISHAGGAHEYETLMRDADGGIHFRPETALYGWPNPQQP